MILDMILCSLRWGIGAFVIFAIFLLLVFPVSGHAWRGEKDRLEANGRYGELERLMETQVPAISTAPTEKLFPLCVAYSKLKRYLRLFQCLDRLEKNIQTGDKFDLAGPSGIFEIKSDITPLPHVMRAEAFIELGQYKKAINEASKANAPFPNANSLSYYSEFHIRLRALTSLTLAHAFTGDRENAGRHQRLLSELSVGFVGGAVKTRVKNIELAKTHVSLGNFERALEIIKKDHPLFNIGGALADAILGASSKGESWYKYLELPTLYIVNKCLLETGQTDQAKGGYDQLLQLPHTRDNGEIYWLILFDRGRIAEKEGKPVEAIEFYRRAIEIIEQQRSSINTEAGKIGFVGDKQSVYKNLIALLFSERRYAHAFEYVERSKSRALVDLLAAKHDFAVKTGDAGKIRALLAVVEKAEEEARIQDDAKVAASESRRLAVNARKQIHEDASELASLVSVSFLPLPEIQARIPPSETLVEYYYDGRNLFAFVLSSSMFHAARLEGGELGVEVRQFRSALENPASTAHLQLSQSLYQRLIKPLEAFLHTRNLILVPHGPLHYLPFNALHSGSDYLVDRHGLRMLPSASVIRYLRKQKPVGKAGILAFGNPDLGDPRYELKHAQAEALEIVRMVPDSRALVRKEATETAVKQFGSEFNYIHFASHGEFNPESPLQSALFLTKDVENDGLLTVAELFTIQLDADLVTLSACETGLGKITSGDDVVGLTRGFLYAGARSIVASLWKVDDLATARLMTRFYELLGRVEKREALRQAQLEIRQQYTHPFFWSAFQLTGNAQ